MDLQGENTSTSPSILPQPVIETSFTTSNHNPPSETLDHLIEIYRTKIHLQPLQLFRLPDLKNYLSSSPQFLLWSFLALTVRHSTHDYYKGQEVKAAEFYADLAHQAVISLAYQGIPKIEVVQALCMLVLVEVAACKPGQAWMSIGTLSRLEALRQLSQPTLAESSPDYEASLGCRWTVFLLEQTFMPQERTTVHDVDEPIYPSSVPRPPNLPPISDGEYPPDLFSDDGVEDLGITAYYIKILGIWGHIASYMHQIRIGKADNAWSPGSMHYVLCAQLYEYDSNTPHSHLLRNVHFTKRSSAEITETREYWIPWVLQQVTSHAITAILNHPFIHLVAMRDRSRGLQSRQFLQQTVDLALYHSAWVFKFLKFCDEQKFKIYDPLVGHLVAVVATIPWLFQRATDHKVAQKAKTDLDWCKDFLERLSVTWPHITQKLEILRSLDSIAENNQQDPNSKGIHILFHPSLFWALVDPKISQMAPSIWNSQVSNGLQDATIRISTHYIQPLVENQVEQPHSVPESNDPFSWDVGVLEHVNLDDIFASWMPDLDEL
ncbi:uncharacterized protein FTOL_03972 [Fusarium torulosum]|uniref:Transcription factor domain-containing protein n=1 Tax=Fusarium torulosum TaxID=33205 RepID=A0AAE8M4W2_9HYPO|nr:uncharacterized protein FTOL_03972 [Fusarium torulosum]